MRIAIGGFLHESHSFAPHPTTYRDFVEPAGFPPLCHGSDLLDSLRHTSVPAAGAIAFVEAQGATIVPLAWGFANPAGPVQDEAFERIAALNCALLSMALDDGSAGRRVSRSARRGDGRQLSGCRRRVVATGSCDRRSTLPLTISLDPHANLTEAMVQLADVVVPFRTYPHVDMKEAGERAARLLVRPDTPRPTLAKNATPIGFLDPAWRTVYT